MGALGWNVNTIIISTDTIDIAVDDNIQLGIPLPTVLLQPESGTTDDLVTINGAKFMQQELWIRGINDTVTITVKNSGNIRTHDGLDFNIVGKKYYKFIYDIADLTWVQATTLGSGGGVSWPIRPDTNPDVTTIDLTNGADSHFFKKTLTLATTTFTIINPPPAGKWQDFIIELTQDVIGGRLVDFTTNQTIEGGAEPTIRSGINEITRLYVMVKDGVSTYKIYSDATGSGFSGKLSDLEIDVSKDWATKSITNLAAIQYVDTGSVARGTISGDAGASAIRLSTVSAGKFIISDVITDIAEFTNSVGLKMLGTHLINAGNNEINAVKQIEFAGNEAMLSTTQGIGMGSVFMKFNVGLTTRHFQWHAADELLMSLTRFGANSGHLQVDNITSDAVNISKFVDFASVVTPSPLNDGMMWLSSTDGKVKVREGGVTFNISGSSSGFSGLLSDLSIDVDKNWNGKTINAVKQIEFNGSEVMIATTQGVGMGSVFMKFNVGLVTRHYQWHAADELLMSLTRFSANSGLLSVDNIVSDFLQLNDHLFLSSTTTPSPLLDGAIWRDSVSGIFKARQSGVTQDLLGGGGGGGDLWSDPLDANIIPDTDALRSIGSSTKRLLDVWASRLKLDSNVDWALSTGGITGNIGTGDNYILNVNSVSKFQVSGTVIDLKDDVILGATSGDKLTINATMADGSNIAVGTSTGTKIGTSVTQKLGFFGNTPTTRSPNYTVANGLTDRNYDANSTSTAELADVLGTLIGDLQTLGLIG